LIFLAERRALLQQRAHAERERLAAVMTRSDEATLLVRRLRRLIEEVRKRPWIVAGVGALLIALRPQRALGWLLKGWSAWRMYRGAQRWWKQFAGNTPDAA
jgi:hypothetical protein